MENKTLQISSILALILTGIVLTLIGFMLARVKDQVEATKEALIHSSTFDLNIFRNALEESTIKIQNDIGNYTHGTAYYSGLSKYSMAVKISTDDRHKIEKLKTFGDIMKKRMLETGCAGEGGIRRMSQNNNEITYRYFYTHDQRVGEIDIFKIDNFIFYFHTESTDIRKF